MRYVVLLAAWSAFAQDPLQVASKHHKKLFENDRVRVLRSQPGAAAGHHHPDSVILDPATGAASFMPAVQHAEDGTSARLIVELKPTRPRSAHGRWYELDPKLYSIVLVNDLVRVAHLKIPPGGETTMQNYLARLMMFLTPGRVVFRSPNTGRSGDRPSAGDIDWAEAGPQQIENEGDDPLQIVIVELK